MARSHGTSSAVRLLVTTVLLIAIGAPTAAADPPGDASYRDHAIDSLICGFPVEADLVADSHVRFVPGHGAQPEFLFPTTLVIKLRNLLTGASVTLRDAEPTSFELDEGTFTFSGNALVTKGPFPVARLSGSTTIDLNDFTVTRFRGTREVVDFCGLLDRSAADGTPRTTPAPWDAGTNPLAAMAEAGLAPTIFAPSEHIHAHLDVFVDGQAVPVPAGIGVVAPVEIGPEIQSAWSTMAPVHTHQAEGIVHIHTAFPELISLGQFFDVWRVRLTNTCLGAYCAGSASTLRVYVNGDLLSGDPRDVVIRPRDQIALAFGPPGVPPTVPASYDFPPGLPQFGFPG